MDIIAKDLTIKKKRKIPTTSYKNDKKKGLKN